MNKYLLQIIILISVCFLPSPAGKNNQTFIRQDSIAVITIAAAGDLMCHSVQYNYARTDSGYNFNPFFDDIREYLSSADFTFANLETVMAGREKGYSGYPFFNSPDEYLDALKNAGFDLLTTSNNHSLDKGESGLRRTIEELKKRNIHYTGTYLEKNDRDSVRMYDIGGIKTAFLAYTYGTNGIPVPKGKPYLINLIDTVLISNDIKNARTLGAEIILVYYHFGEEYKNEPGIYQKEVVSKTIAAGADLIIGGHPHVLQPVDYFTSENANLDTGFTAYSLGNFFSNQRWRYSDAGTVLYLTISKNFSTGEVKLENTEYLPTWVYKDHGIYKILPAENHDVYEFLSSQDRQKMEEAFNDTKEILTKYSSKISLKQTTEQNNK